MADGQVGLDTALDALRDDLESAWRAGKDHQVRFRTSEVTLTVETVARVDKDGSGKIRWYVVEAGGGVKVSSERTQTLTLTLTLTPLLYDERGQPMPLEVAGNQPTPAQ